MENTEKTGYRSEFIRILRTYILYSLGFGMLVWVLDAVLDYNLFYVGHGTLIDNIILNVSAHELYIRLIIVAIFLVFGILTAFHVFKRRKLNLVTQHLNQVLNATKNVHRLIGRENDIDSFIKKSCETLVETRGYQYAWIVLYNDAGSYETSAESGLGEIFEPLNDRLKAGKRPECIGRTLENCDLAVIKDPASECSDCPLSNYYKNKGAMAICLQYQGKVLGVMVVSLPSEFIDISDEHDLFREVSKDIALAIKNIQTEGYRKEAEKKHHKTYNQLQLALAASDAGMWDWDLKANEIFYEEYFIEDLGYQPHEIKQNGGLWENLINPDDKPFVKEKLEKYLSGTTDYYNVEYRLKTRQDSWKWILDRGRIMEYDQQGNPARMTGTLIDISERKQIEEELRQNGENLRITLDSIGDAVIVTDNEGTITEINPVAAELTGRSKDEAEGSPLHEVFRIINTETREKAVNPVFKVLETGKISGLANHTVLISKNGEEYQIADSGSPIKGDDGKTRGVILVFRDITEDYRMREALEKSEQQLKKAQVIARMGSWQMDLKNNIMDLSEEFRQICGLKKDKQYTVEEIQQLSLPEYQKLMDKVMRENMQGKSDFDLEIKIQRPSDGKIVDIHSMADYDQEKETITGVVRDITKRKRTEAALKQSEQDYKELFESAHDGIVVFIPENEIVLDVNQRACELYGIGRDEFIGISMERFSLDVQQGKQHIEKTLEKGFYHHFEKMQKRADGTMIWLEINASVVTYKGHKAILSHNRDITERKQAENALRESEEKFRLMYENMEVGIARINLDFYFDAANEAYCRMLGYSEEELVGMHLRDITHPDIQKENLAKYSQMASGEIDHFQMEKKFIHKNGEVIYGITDSNLIRDSEENPSYFLAGVVDITDRKKAEEDLQRLNEELNSQNEKYLALNEELQKSNEELVRAKSKAEESDRLKSAFLANMSHEIRTPMNGIMGFTQLLKDQNYSEEQQKRYLEIIERSGKRMLDTINDLVDISKLETGQVDIYMSKVNFNQQLKYFFDFFKPEADNKNIQLTYHLELPDESAVMETDEPKFSAVLNNLLKNALKYTNSGKIDFGYKVKDGFIEFYVEDTGVGISAERLDTVFERFVKEETNSGKINEGSGLGLAISKAYMDMLGGEFHVKSEENKGSRFYFTLPFEKPDETVSKKMESKQKPDYMDSMNSLTFLIVEDEKTSDIYLTELLGHDSKAIVHAQKGEEALNIMKQRDDIDVILMDIKIPQMDGLEVTRKIREFNNNVKIIAQTAYALSGDREKALEAGCDEYLAKPIGKDALFEVLNKLFNEN